MLVLDSSLVEHLLQRPLGNGLERHVVECRQRVVTQGSYVGIPDEDADQMARASFNLGEHREKLATQISIFHFLVDLTVLLESLVERLQLVEDDGAACTSVDRPVLVLGRARTLLLYRLNQMERSLIDQPQ